MVTNKLPKFGGQDALAILSGMRLGREAESES
jgi:hypothetical protein